MVKISLQISGTLENVAKVFLAEPESYYYTIKLKCTSCQKLGTLWASVSASEEQTRGFGDPTVNFLSPCEFCHKDKVINVLLETAGAYTKDEEGRFKTIIAFDCRGVEPVEFDFCGGWTVVSVSGREFEHVYIQDGKWVDFDEGLKESVALYNMKSQFVKE